MNRNIAPTLRHDPSLTVGARHYGITKDHLVPQPETFTIANAMISSESANRVTIDCSNGRISRIDDKSGAPTYPKTLDAGGRLVAPGLIDVHIQGAGGADILDGSEEAFATIARTCARAGVTSFVATTVFRPGGDNSHLEAAAKACGKDLGGARMIGIHLEGPFIAPEKRGMIRPDNICSVSMSILDEIRELTGSALKIMTLAPELPGCLDMIRELRRRGVVCAFAHSAADYSQTVAGIDAGITQATHLFNAMPSIHHRAPGPVPAILESSGVTAQVIPDGVHIHPSVVRMVWRALGRDRFISITDGVRALGLPDGTYEYNGVTFESHGGAARYRDGTLIGTATGLCTLVKRLAEFTGCSIDDAIRTATETPARSLGISDRKGGTAVGKDADMVIFSDDGTVWKTIVGGRVVYETPEEVSR